MLLIWLQVISCIETGTPLLMENLPEDIDAVLDPVIGKQTIKRGRNLILKIGDAEVEYDQNFRFVLLCTPSHNTMSDCASSSYRATLHITCTSARKNQGRYQQTPSTGWFRIPLSLCSNKYGSMQAVPADQAGQPSLQA